VESLLNSHAQAGSFLDKPAVDLQSAAATLDRRSDRSGQRIGVYQLVGEIGRGGMGEVYRARRADAHYEMEVAIKLVRGGYDSDFVLQRFKAERQILASLDHPNIARLLDGGATEDGLPYLVMELVDGEPIDKYCDARELPIPARLRLFRDVCAAVSYAHQHLVVHRDLKPSNILVTTSGSVKLLDFGIAKLLQAPGAESTADLTVTAVAALTLAFSSPEQVLGLPITTSSDVYSLGVVLFHLLTGRSPYRRTLTSTRDAIQEICDIDPARPSVVAAELAPRHFPRAIPDRELDDITLRAIRKEPDKRYRSVEQLSEDLQRYLTGLPVIAHGDQFGYRAGKFVRRHRIELGAAAAVGLTLLGSTIVSTHEAHVAQQALSLAERDFARVRKLANSLMFELHDAIAPLPGATAARKLLVSNALQYLEELSTERSDNDALDIELAVAYRKVGDIQGGANSQNAGQVGAAVDSYRKSVALLERVTSKDKENLTARSELLQSLRLLALGELYNGKIDLASRDSRRAVEIASQVLTADPGVVKSQHDLAVTNADLCHVLTAAGRPADGLIACRKGIELQERVVRAQPVEHAERRWLGVMYGRAARAINQSFFHTKSHPESLQEALALQRQGIAIDESLSESSDANELARRDLVTDHNCAAETLYLAQDYDGAVAEFGKSIALLETVIAGDPQNVQAQINAAVLQRNVGETYVTAGQAEPAMEAYAAVFRMLRALPAMRDNVIVEHQNAAAVLGLARAHELAASSKGLNAKSRLAQWRAAERGFSESKALYASLRARGALLADYSTDADEASAGMAKSEAAIRKLTASTAAADTN
jgi:tetratricopeptide (TPR) repeat protein